MITLGLQMKAFFSYSDTIDQLTVSPWYSSLHNMGMAMNRETFRSIQNCSEVSLLFCCNSLISQIRNFVNTMTIIGIGHWWELILNVYHNVFMSSIRDHREYFILAIAVYIIVNVMPTRVFDEYKRYSKTIHIYYFLNNYMYVDIFICYSQSNLRRFCKCTLVN